MILRVVAVAAGLTCGAGLAQFPEYAQQYTQRLGGAVDELARVVSDFDASAAATGFSRAEALNAMRGNALQLRLRDDMERNIARHARLASDYDVLSRATTLGRLTALPRLTAPQIAERALEGFEPAIKLDFEGIGFALAGYVLGLSLVQALGRVRRIFRRRAAKP